MGQEIVLASNNQKKAAELSAILGSEHIRLIAQGTLNITEAAETGTTFIENALIKARHAAELSGLPAIADDSGICVAALNGAPGIYSARYSGMGDNANNTKLLAALADSIDRSACYVCVIVYLTHADDPLPLIAQGIWHGKIATTARGNGGFGYDPLFIPHGFEQTVAEISGAEKNKISHRALALQHFITQYRCLNNLS